MSLLVPADQEAFTVRVQSYSTSNPSQKWSNNYTIYNQGSGTYNEIIDTLKNIARFHNAMTQARVVTERLVVSTFAQDSNPYNGNEFTTLDWNLSGDRIPPVGSELPFEVCLFLRKQTNIGRTGKTFLRGCLGEGDVEFGESLFKLTNPNALAAEVSNALISSNLIDNLAAGFNPFKIVLVNTAEALFSVRIVAAMVVSGARMVNMNKRYYDRS